MNEYQKLLTIFPEQIARALDRFSGKDAVCEIRLRTSLPLSLTTFAGNVMLNEKGESVGPSRGIGVTKEELTEIVSAFCEGSVYRYIESLEEGFLVNQSGVRMGICYEQSSGSFSTAGSEIGSLNFRIPRTVPGAAKELLRFFRQNSLQSTLLISLPGAGKTTLMRDLAISLSRGDLFEAKRIAVIDERKELFPAGCPKGMGLCDLFSGYPKARGIEIATRVLAPEVILCDEIGGNEDTGAILSAQAGGGVLLASAHAASLEGAMAKPHLKRLFDAGVFSVLAILEKEPAKVYRSHLTFCRVP